MTQKQQLALSRAKILRKNMTDAEQRLWWYLGYNKKILGNFRRQESVDYYIADFLCYRHRLIIEVDGAHHNETVDGKRDAYLTSNGFQVLRFGNHDVMYNINMVLDTIYAAITSPPRHCFAMPTLPQGEGEPAGAQ